MNHQELAEEVIQKSAHLIRLVAADPEEQKNRSAEGAQEQIKIDTKVHIRPVVLKDQLHLQFVSYRDNKAFTSNTRIDRVGRELEALFSIYRHIIITFEDEEWHLSRHHESPWKIKRKKLESTRPASLEHNRSKLSIIDECADLPFLKKLGVMKENGGVVSSMRHKFHQINRFLEIVGHTLKQIPKNSDLLIYDLGCGKAYLTFALYHLLQTSGFTKFSIVGVDRKSDVMSFCNDVVQDLSWNLPSHSLRFEVGSIDTVNPKRGVDIVIALHACDTATDDILAKAVDWGAQAILVAPCCQQEVLKQLNPKCLPALLSHGLVRERFAALLTDAMRVHLLEQKGYDVDCIEFVDPEHTPKNLLIRAAKKPTKASSKLDEEYASLKKLFHVEPKLERLLNEKTSK